MPAKKASKKPAAKTTPFPPDMTMTPLSVTFLVWLFTALSIVFFAIAIYRYA